MITIISVVFLVSDSFLEGPLCYACRSRRMEALEIWTCAHCLPAFLFPDTFDVAGKTVCWYLFIPMSPSPNLDTRGGNFLLELPFAQRRRRRRKGANLTLFPSAQQQGASFDHVCVQMPHSTHARTLRLLRLPLAWLHHALRHSSFLFLSFFPSFLPSSSPQSFISVVSRRCSGHACM